MSDVFAAVEAAAALHQSGRLEEAQAAYLALLELPGTPRPTLLQLIALLHAQANRPCDALAAYDALTAEGGGSPAVDRARAEALNDRALGRQAAGRLTEALADYDAALALAPDLTVAWSNRSVALRRLGQREAARESAERALSLNPNDPDTLNNLGLALFALNRLEGALQAYDRALQLRPDWPDALNNAGIALAALGRLEAAEAHHRTAANADPANGAYPYNLALLALRRGEFEAGWRGYEHRWRRPGQPGPTYPDATLWLGDEDITGRTVLLHAEQGLGDTLQFCRYASTVKARGAHVLMEVQPPLLRLMRTLNGVDGVTAVGDPPPSFDRHTPLMSLPLALRLAPDTAEGRPPYLLAEAPAVEGWRERLSAVAGTRRAVGLVWRGNPAHENDHNRSIPLPVLEPLVRIAQAAGFAVVSLQTPVGAADARRLRDLGVTDLGGGLTDFADTAALLEALDLLVTVDTSIVHLAGALGRPAWLMLPGHGDWRWMDGREDSPWYPSLRLFRQHTLGNWAGVVGRVGAAIGAWVDA